MGRIDEPEWQRRERRRSKIAFNIRDSSGNLKLRTSNREINLSEGDNTLYNITMIKGVISPKEMYGVIKDIISSAKREEYSQSLLSKIALRFGYIPNRILFQRN